MKAGLWSRFTEFLVNSKGHSFKLMLVAFALSAAVMLVLVTIYYLCRCSRMKNTAMSGFLDVLIELNRGTDREDLSRMSMGRFRIGIDDCGAKERQEVASEELFFPYLSFLERAEQRLLSVGTVLRRFTYGYDAAGLKGDKSSELLHALIEDPSFCDTLGELCYSSRNGLESEFADSSCDVELKAENDPDTIRITAKIPTLLASEISSDPAEQLSNICLTIHYDPTI